MTALSYCASSSLGRDDAKVAAALAEIAERLIENGADPTGSVDRACWSSNTAVLRVLLEHGGRVQDDDTVNHAACDGLTEPLDLLVEYGVPLDGTKGTGHHGGYTPLGCAVSCRSLRGVKWFIEKGQDPNRIKSKTGENSLHVAVNWKASDKMLGLLLKAGTKLNAKDRKGRTPLALAREKGHRKAITFLEKVGAQS